MDLSGRIKATSIENRNYTKLLKQMNYQRLNNPKIKFSFKNEKYENYEGDLLKGSPNSSMNNYSFDLNQDFNIIPNDSGNTDDRKVIEDEAFVRELRFFKVDENMDTITLSSKLLTGENYLKDKIVYFSDSNAFSSNTK